MESSVVNRFLWVLSLCFAFPLYMLYLCEFVLIRKMMVYRT